MENEATALTDAVTVADVVADVAAATDIADELLVEEISIDGMCGVY
jgi:mycofactocin precursor